MKMKIKNGLKMDCIENGDFKKIKIKMRNVFLICPTLSNVNRVNFNPFVGKILLHLLDYPPWGKTWGRRVLVITLSY